MLNGDGYGSDHDWRFVNGGRGWTTYRCKDCSADFNHVYDATPSVWEAIKEADIPEMCSQKAHEERPA